MSTPEQQEEIKPEKTKDPSIVFGISVRAFLAIMITGTFCLISLVPVVQSFFERPVTIIISQESLNNLAIMTVGFYLGQHSRQKEEK